MPAKRALRFSLDKKVSREPLKSAAQNGDERDVPGPGSHPAAGQTTHEPIIQHRDVEKLHTLTSKLEKSGGAFIKARKRLEEIVAAEGNPELKSFLGTSSADWNTELARNRQLTSRAELQLKEGSSRQSLYKVDGAMAGSSYEFLKSILG
ncbi:unnamed protein product [Lota lota]